MQLSEFSGDKLRQCREQIGLTQVQLAKSLGFTKSYINQIESGRASNPSLRFLRGVDAMFGLQISGASGVPKSDAPQHGVVQLSDVQMQEIERTINCSIHELVFTLAHIEQGDGDDALTTLTVVQSNCERLADLVLSMMKEAGEA